MASGQLKPTDPSVTPSAYHCATLSDGELAQLRRIKKVIRLGNLTALGANEVRPAGGTSPTGPSTLHVDCSAAGFPPRASTTVFDGDRITLQMVRTCQPTFSASFI